MSRKLADLVLLENVTNEAIVSTLSVNYKSDQIYTYIGHVLISVNPFKDISGLYSSGTLKKYVNKKEYQNSPHIYALAERAYRGMVMDLGKECVIISGESGAGKTEAAKKVMEYAAALSSKSKEVQRTTNQILQTNPLLESFGNAKTVRNNNSSRFGKYMELSFNLGNPRGGNILVYLLEKNRVNQQQKDERNFHIFYQIFCAGSDEKKRWELSDPSSFRLLNRSGCLKVSGINDASEYSNTRKAMNIIGMSESQQANLFDTLAAILHLGNIDFVADEKQGSSVSQGVSATALAAVGRLLQVQPRSIEEALTNKTITSRGDSVQSPLLPAAAASVRDSLTKTIYGRIFDWIVATINTTINVEGSSTSLGVLDIYGFEILQGNGFEQLCINFVNERLHQLFIELTLKAEQEEYAKEGIQWQPIQYFNNKPICELIERRGGLISLLDEECVFPNGSDSSFFEKIKSQLGNCSVTYDTVGILDKNKDLLIIDAIKMMVSASNPIAKSLFENDPQLNSSKRPVTTGTQFKKQVGDLMTTLSACNQHYVRCIKPNESKRAGVIEDAMFTSQVKYLGLLENVKVRRAGYAFRMPFDRFIAKYKAVGKDHPEWVENAEEGAKELLKNLGFFKDSAMGKTKVFVKSPTTVFSLEDLRNKFISNAAAMVTKAQSSDDMIFVDKVWGFDKKLKRSPITLCIAAQGIHIYGKDKKLVHRAAMDAFTGITLPSDDGWMVLHMRLDGSEEEFVYLCENIYKAEVQAVLDVLQTCNANLEMVESSTIPLAAKDPEEAKRQAKEAAKVNKKGCNIL